MRVKLFSFLVLAFSVFSCTKVDVEELATLETYNVSGRIIDGDNKPVEEVLLFYKTNDYALSDSNGHWEISNLAGPVIIDPKKENYIFSKIQIDVSKADTNIVIVAIPDNKVEDIPEQWKETYNWVKNMQLFNGLLESSENTDFVSLYDNALASLVFMAQGDVEKAEKLFNFFNDRVDTEFLQGTGGFYQYRNADGENGGRTWIGDNAWLLIALNHYHKMTGNQKYQHMAEELEKWLRSQQDQDGGLWGGYNEDGTQIHKITEGIIMAFNAVEGYDDFHKKILAYLKANRWDNNEMLLTAWPENPEYRYALDLHSLGYGIFEDFPESVLYGADLYLNTQIATINGEEVTGYCFDEDKDAVWLEGTAQMAMAFQLAGMEGNKDNLLKELEKTFIASTLLESSKGIPFVTNYATGYGSNVLWDHADIAPALSSTAWYLMARLNFNPLEMGRQKNIPETDKFWIQKI